MKLKLPLIFAIGLFFILACNQSNSKTSEASTSDLTSLEDEVIGIHDEVMPKMGQLSKLGTALHSLTQVPGFNNWAQPKQEELQKAINDISTAEKSMWNWMYGYEPPSESGMPENEAKTYLADQKEKITIVRDKMLDAIDQAEKYLKKYDIDY